MTAATPTELWRMSATELAEAIRTRQASSAEVFCLCGSIALTWAGTDNRLAAIAPFYGAAPKPRAAIRRMCPVVGSWPGKDFTTKAAGVRRPS